MTTWTLGADHPLALFPVRVETRFVGTDLRVRIYPGDFHVDTHEPELTGTERDWGRRYWAELAAATTAAAAQAAWDRLVAGFGPERAAWVARQLEPTSTQPVPEPPSRPAAWSRAPVATGLPTRWHVTALIPGQAPVTRISAEVARPLQVGPSPTPPPAGGPAGPVEPGLLWLTDYQTAVDAGMAVTLPVGAAQQVTRLLVFGVRENVTAGQGADLLGKMLDAQYYTGGLGFVPHGTPTNNTDTATSGYSRQDPAYRSAYRFVAGRGRQAAAAGSNAAATARALGLRADAVAATEPLPAGRSLLISRGADRLEETAARAMNTALWGATWGYHLWQIMAPVLGDDDIRYGRQHFLDHVRAGGPLPALRAGRQPYGLLPVTALAQWAPREATGAPAARDQALLDLLRQLQSTVWRPAAARLPALDGTETAVAPDDRQKLLVQILGMAPVTRQFRARPVLGPEYVENLWRFMRLQLPDTFPENQSGRARALLERLGRSTWRPRGAGMVYGNDSFPLTAPLVLAGHADGVVAYLDLLRAGTPYRDLVNLPDFTVGGARTPLLYRLLRHALLTELSLAAARILRRQGNLPAGADAEPELVDIRPDITTPTAWRRLDAPAPGGGTLGAYLLRPESATDVDGQEVHQVRAALGVLRDVPVDGLERLLGETLDLASHRLDAWLTSYATKRLAWLRARNPNGVHVGAYGWVENLRRRGGASGLGGQAEPVVDPDSVGFVHAPSLPQAVTAAVLRSGYRTHAGAAGGPNPLAVDLSSDRVRLATWLLDGIRQGQDLAALLGYRFERGLHDDPGTVPLDAYIARFRQLAPIRLTRVDADRGPTEVVAAHDVVDGLELHRLWKAGRIDWNGDPELPDVGSGDHRRLLAVLAALDDAVDALSDALLAESVHHAVQGNPMRAGATLDAASRGEAPPPELEVVRTPRSGVAVTHRLLVAMRPQAAPPDDWPVDARQVRAAAEPAVNAWAASLLSPPAGVRVGVRWQHPGTGDVLARTETTLDRLRLSPLDYLHLPEQDDTAAQSELELRLARSLGQPPDGVPADAVLRLDFGRPPHWEAHVLSVAEFLETVRALRQVIRSARPLNAADLQDPSNPTPAVLDEEDLRARATSAATALAAVATRLAAESTADQEEGLLRAASFGVQGALPPPGPVSGPALTAQVGAVRDEVSRRLAAEADLRAGFDRAAADPQQRRDHDLDRLRAVLGPDFTAVATFRLADPAPLTEALRVTDAPDDQPLATEDWLARAATVRPGAERLATALTYAEAAGRGGTGRLVAAQFRQDDDEPWVGLNPPPALPGGSRVSLVLHLSAPLDTAGPVAGLAVDDWVEILPGATETTGVAFNVDAPSAAAPQAVLLAVSPDARPAWSSELVQDILDETRDLARLRAVDLDVLGDVGQFLPALYVADNQGDEAVSTDFSRGEPARS
ncbi:hypothetical protein [Micromonospora costi]|uniref:Uncharacterized protein n=1 Tax=Micromonospora costi TaxID=1530042 RepID=A0A3A9ZV05_9ACTN|nr:hypothetical protein [Micromonospora costi]RKN52095.1 hypothetical protein D7193_26390 [Micromonospora costi]